MLWQRARSQGDECRIADHLSSGDARGTISFSSRRTRATVKQRRELRRIELHGPASARRRQLEHRAVQAFVQQAVAVAVEPERLEPRRVAIGEHEERARLRVFAKLASNELRETVEPLAHVDGFRAHEDADRCRNHADSKISSSARSCCASKALGMCSRRPRTSSSNRALEPWRGSSTKAEPGATVARLAATGRFFAGQTRFLPLASRLSVQAQ